MGSRSDANRPTGRQPKPAHQPPGDPSQAAAPGSVTGEAQTVAGAPFQLEIFTPGRCHYSGTVIHLRAPGRGGSFGVMARHQAILAVLDAGVLVIDEGPARTRLFGITGGVFEMADNQATVLANRLIDPTTSEGVGFLRSCRNLPAPTTAGTNHHPSAAREPSGPNDQDRLLVVGRQLAQACLQRGQPL